MRKFILAMVLLLTILFVISRFAEVQEIGATLADGDWHFLMLAILLQAGWLVNQATSYRVIYNGLGIQEKGLNMLKVATAAYFLSIVAPSGGFSGIAVLISNARKNGHSPGRATVAGALYVLFDYVGFLCVLTIGLAVLARRNDLSWPEITASVIMVAIALAMTAFFYLGMRSAGILGSVLAWLVRLTNRLLVPFLHRNYLSESTAYDFANDAAEGIQALRRQPRTILLSILLALSNKAFLIGVLWLIFLAFDAPFTLGTLIAGFSMGYLFLIVSPTPSGIGIVEGALTLVLTTLMVPLEAAAVIVLAYRGVTFWMPFFIGMVSFRTLTHKGQFEKLQVN